jgi:hypothetical protein
MQPKLPPYDGTGDPRPWLRTAQLAIGLAGAAEPGWLLPDRQVQQLCASLRGPAATWRDSRWPYGTPCPWPDTDAFALAFIPAHTPVNDAELARKQLWGCAQTGDLEDYIKSFRGIILRIPGIADDESKDRFVHGLQPRVMQQVNMDSPATLEAAYAAAQHAASSIPATISSSSTGPTLTHAPAPAAFSHHDEVTPMDLNAVEAALCAMGFTRNSIKCWYCEGSHMRDRCPNLQSVRCQLCGQKGHGAASCFKLKNLNNTHH